MSFKDRDETPEERKQREYNENPNNFPKMFITYCKKCGCHYTNGCNEHSESDQEVWPKK